MISSSVVIMTRDELSIAEAEAFQRGVRRGKFEADGKLVSEWVPLSEGFPKDRHVMLRGASGYVTTPHRVMVAKFDTGYGEWRTCQNDRVTDDGEMPTHWMELIP
jgi:hypothetical protein